MNKTNEECGNRGKEKKKSYKDIFMNKEKQWLMEKHENSLEWQHANKGKAFFFSVVFWYFLL